MFRLTRRSVNCICALLVLAVLVLVGVSLCENERCKVLVEEALKGLLGGCLYGVVRHLDRLHRLRHLEEASWTSRAMWRLLLQDVKVGLLTGTFIGLVIGAFILIVG
jgi:hypothetical protein